MGGFDCGAEDFAIALPRVTVSEKEQRSRFENRKHYGRALAHSVVVHIAAEIIGILRWDGGLVRGRRRDTAQHRAQRQLDA